MAGRPKKSVNTDVKNTETNVNDAILAQLKELQEQMLALKAENEALKENKQITVDELNGDTEIEVISQFVGKLALSTDGNGMGTVYRFEKFGDVQDIPFSDLKEIVKNKPSFAKEGLYYIANKEAVNKLRLAKDYEHIVDNKIFEHILDEQPDTVIKAYKNAPKLQQEQIISMIEERLANDKSVDGNILISIGKLSGKNFLHNNVDDE
jgi:hypothetical protein